ncbi:MAG: hypothetical protein C0171_00145 [Caldisphaera sp.]|uniref:hypothetical protein n=1 Tax=Caldisphaera sp. TaxID=2060322 RepID=UPI000CB805EA|nr:MAG: hypothetical protein C0171_00145 [Caldisphaera sp.]
MKGFGIKIASLLLTLMVIGAIIFPFVNAQPSSNNGNAENQNSTLILLNITSKAINFAKNNGINVTLAQKYYQLALSSYNEGNYTQAQIYLHLAMKVLAKQMESKKETVTPVLQAEGIKVQLKLIENFVSKSKLFNETYKNMILSQINQSLLYLNEGNVSQAAKTLSEIKQELMQASVKISDVAKQRVSHFIKNKIKNEINNMNKMFESEMGNVTSEFSYNVNVTPVLSLVEKEINSTNISVNTYAHILIALNNLENFIANQKISFVFNLSGRNKELWGILINLEAINRSLNMVSARTNNQNINNAISLMEESINETKFSIKEWYIGNDTGALKLINESIQNDIQAQQYLSNTSGMANMLIPISNRIYKLDYMVLKLINNTIIIGKSVEIEGFVIWNLSSNSYLIVGHIISIGNNMMFMPVTEHMWQLMIINVSKSTQINGTIYPNEVVKINGIITGKYYAIYEVNATQITVLSNSTNTVNS